MPIENGDDNLRDAIHNRMRELGYSVFEGEPAHPNYDLNIVGLRTRGGKTGEFDDLMTVSYKLNGQWRFHAWPCTTEPGGKYLKAPPTSAGTAIIAPGRYSGSHEIGLHGASKPWVHEALVQRGVLRVWHDNDRDQTVDYGENETQSGSAAGLNIHRDLGDFSAGCQVFKSRADFAEFMSLVHRQKEAGLGTVFTYTLLDWPPQS